MKNKILLSTLLGSALLVGCTADDVLDVNKAAVKVNPDAPVFNVSFVSDDASMRGDMGGGTMVWDTANDKLSLYHGGGVKDNSDASKWAWKQHDGDDAANFLVAGEIRNFDAIYAQTSTADGVNKLTTESVVSEGYAIMVYPADTAYTQDGRNPILRISNEQNKDTKNSTPFISEVLTIGQYNSKAPANTAGYGREYDVALRRVAGQMRLQLKAENQETLKSAGVDDIQYRKVTVTVTKAATTAGGKDEVVTNPFTTETVVRIGQQRYTEGATGIPTDGDGVVGLNPKDGSLDHWSYTPWLEPVDEVSAGATLDKNNNKIKASNTISTTDITTRLGEKEAIYTLLPYDDRKDYSTAVYNEDGTPKYDKVVIDVETYYGNIQVVELDGGAKVWADSKGNESTLVDGLSTLMKEMFAPYTNEADKANYPRYRNQLLPVNKLGIITVDWKNLDFNNLHITSSDQLRDVLKVYNALYPDAVNGQEAQLILDGDGSGVFTMNQDAWELVEEQLKKDGNKVTFKPCENHGKTKAPKGCVTVRLNGGTTTTDIPELAFEKNSQSTDGIDLELTGNWKYNGKNEKTNNTAHNYLAIDGVKEIHVANKAVLTVSGAVTASKDGSSASEVKLVIDNGGTMQTADGIVYIDQDVENKGTINIPANTELRMTSNATLTNRETQDGTKVNDVYTATGLTTAKIGVINVTGKLNVGATSTTNPSIVNLGEIYQKTDNAYVLVTANADLQNSKGVETSFERKDFGGSNNHIYGSIYLSSVNGCGNVSVKGINDHTKEEAGFIKLEVSANNAKKAAYGNANYVIFKGDSIWSEKNTDTGVEYFPSTVLHIEIASDKDVRFGGSTQYRVRSLVVPENKTMTVEYGSNVYVGNAVYTKGQIYGSGILMMQKDVAKFTNYFGGDANDEYDHVGTSNGVTWKTYDESLK